MGADRLPDRVVGVTGSVGKTSTKDLLAAVLATTFRTHASHRSFNNEIGVPLTLLNAPGDTEVAVVEMGARGSGHIAELCAVARPTAAIVTAVAHAHTELFGTIDDVARAKSELVASIPSHGLVVLNADDERVAAMAHRADAEVVTYGERGDVRAEALVLDVELRPRFRLCSPWGDIDVVLEARGEHMATNALAAAAVGLRLGVPLDAVAAGLGRARLSPMRMEVLRTPTGATVINDSYNANPASMRAALQSLASLPARRRFAVLGVMAELGHQGEVAHRDIAQLAADLGIRVIAVAAPAYGSFDHGGIDHVDDLEGAVRALVGAGALVEGDAVLVKGSRVAGLERLAERLLVSPEPDG